MAAYARLAFRNDKVFAGLPRRLLGARRSLSSSSLFILAVTETSQKDKSTLSNSPNICCYA